MQWRELEKLAKSINYYKTIPLILGYDIINNVEHCSETKTKRCFLDVDEEETCSNLTFDLEDYETSQYIRNISVILIGKKYWKENKRNPIEIKMMLLHEIGHAKKWNFKTFHKMELEAQLWGIKRAGQMGMVNVRQRMIDRLYEWKDYPYPYKGAHRLFVKSGIIL